MWGWCCCDWRWRCLRVKNADVKRDGQEIVSWVLEKGWSLGLRFRCLALLYLKKNSDKSTTLELKSLTIAWESLSWIPRPGIKEAVSVEHKEVKKNFVSVNQSLLYQRMEKVMPCLLRRMVLCDFTVTARGSRWTTDSMSLEIPVLKWLQILNVEHHVYYLREHLFLTLSSWWIGQTWKVGQTDEHVGMNLLEWWHVSGMTGNYEEKSEEKHASLLSLALFRRMRFDFFKKRDSRLIFIWQTVCIFSATRDPRSGNFDCALIIF